MVDLDGVPLLPGEREVAELATGGRGLLDIDGSFALQRSETPAMGPQACTG